MENREYLSSAAAAAPSRPGAPSGGYPQGGLTPTKPGPYWYHQMGEELRAILTAAGVMPDGTVLTQLAQSLRRIYGGNVTTVNNAMSPFNLTSDHAGLVVIDATAGNVVLNLPAVGNVLSLAFVFARGEATANTGTVNRNGADVIDGAATSFTVAAGDYYAIKSAGIVATIGRWLTTSTRYGVIPIGGVIDCFTTATPAAFLLCPIAATNISRATYAALFAAIGTAFGVGDGATTFGMPWFPADYASVQASGNMATSTIGETVQHNHVINSAAGGLTDLLAYNNTNGGAGQAGSLAFNGKTYNTGGSANLAAGVRAKKFVRYI